MEPIGITFFAVTLFLALTMLIKWKCRRDEIAARLNRGLRGYAAKSTDPVPETPETHREGLLPV